MPTYVLPQVLVFQEFRVVPAAVSSALPAFISGPHAKLLRYRFDDERELAQLGYYDRLLSTSYPWPERPAGSVVDESYTKVFIKDALLKYYEDSIGSGSVITKMTGFNNRIRSATRSFASNGPAYPRFSGFYDRDVQPGDIAKVRGISSPSGNPITLWTYVKRVLGDQIPSAVGAASSDISNAATQTASSTITKVAGPDNCVVVTVDHTLYNGLPTGHITETYDVLVTASSVNGDYTKATLRIISGSGTDDQLVVVPAAKGVPFNIGTRGLKITVDELDTAACSASAAVDNVSADDLIVGQRWHIVVNQAFTAPTATSGGTFDSDHDTTYIVTVTKGGHYVDPEEPEITVTTTNGLDVSGPTPVPAAATPVPCGTLGVTVQFSGTGLRKGDRYHITCTGRKTGPMRIIELGHNLDSSIPGGSEVDLTLYIRKPVLSVPKNRIGFAPLTNWSQSETEITLHDDMTAFDDSWTNLGVPMPLEVHSEPSMRYGMAYVEARYWLSDLSYEIGTIHDVGDLDDMISGALDPDNPLKWGVFKALENANGVAVKFCSVAEPDKDESWAKVLELALGRDDVYNFVPLTRRRTVQDLFAAHVKALSTPEQGLWRVAWFNLQGIPKIPVVAAGSSVPGHTQPKTTDGNVALARVIDDPHTSGSQYTILQCTSGNAPFLHLGVRPKDVVRLLYTTDGFGNELYSEFVVDEVQSENQLRLISGPDAPINVPAKFEIWRNLSATEEAHEIAKVAGSWNDRRIRAVWPDEIESAGTVMPGYFLCAALAALSSGVLPHQGLTHVELVGFSKVSRTVDKFNRAQLDKMAEGGTWIVTQDVTGIATRLGSIYTRHALTTGNYNDINQREEMLTRNMDSISYRFKNHFRPFIGVTNVTPVIEARIYSEALRLIDVLRSENSTARLGGQLIDGTVIELRPHLLFKDRFVLRVDCQMPYPFNNLEIKLTV